MASLNRAQIIGNLGGDPDMKYTPSGAAVCSFSVATTEKWVKDGQKQEKTTWHRIVVWGKTAEACAKYLAKGRQVYIDGRIETREYEKNGQKRYITEIVAQDVQFLGGGKGERREDDSPTAERGRSASSNSGSGYGGADEDIPF